jgi:alkylation response protein AidB-like acyl-CoA dehydrogenase
MIDFTLTEEQELFRKAAREFAETEVAPEVSEMEATCKVCDGIVKALGEAEMSGPPYRPGGNRQGFGGDGHDAPGFWLGH